MSGQGLYLAVPTPKAVVLLKLYVLRRDSHPATIKLLHSRNIFILTNSKRAFNKSTIPTHVYAAEFENAWVA